MAVKKSNQLKAATGNIEKDISDCEDYSMPFSERQKRINQINKRIQEAYPLISGNSSEDMLWRSVTSGSSQRDLTPITHERMRDIAFWLWDSNPLGHRLVSIMTDFIIGDGFTFKAEDQRVQEVLEAFWHDPENNIDESQYIDVTELCLFGELCFPVWVNPADGHVKLGYLDPALIKKVTKSKKNPRLLDKVYYTKNRRNSDQAKLKIVNVDRKIDSKTNGQLVGDCLYYTINKVWSATRGRSDLLSVADWLDGYDQFLFARLERAFLLNSFIWDITVEGADKKELKEFIKTIAAPKPGSIRAHNEKIKWDAVTPKLEADDASQEARMFKNQILGGAGYPEHWFAEGSTTTRATATEMGLPTLKRLRTRQIQVKFMYQNMLNFQIDQAIIHGALDKNVNRKFSMIPDPIVSRDNKGMATAVKTFTEGLVMALDKKWITEEEASYTFKLLMTQCGAEFSTRPSIRKENAETDITQKPYNKEDDTDEE